MSRVVMALFYKTNLKTGVKENAGFKTFYLNEKTLYQIREECAQVFKEPDCEYDSYNLFRVESLD